jgi:hypothetical protein
MDKYLIGGQDWWFYGRNNICIFVGYLEEYLKNMTPIEPVTKDENEKNGPD